jgi:hypothetical protein
MEILCSGLVVAGRPDFRFKLLKKDQYKKALDAPPGVAIGGASRIGSGRSQERRGSRHGQHSLYDLLSAAGGPTSSEGPTITITQKGDAEHPEVLHVRSATFSDQMNQTPVYPGDNVFVSKAV